MIIVITYVDRKTGKRIVNYGINMKTDQRICLPNIPIDQMPKIRYDSNLQEFILDN